MSTQAAWSRLVIDALVRSGVREAVISPGSRSTPFVLAAVGHDQLRCHRVIDERAAAFFGLGMAKVTGKPTLLVCTSGSAPAHYFPAVMEAAKAGVPLVLLTADRPLELHDCGANQTVDQVHLFGSHVRAFVDLGVAEEREDVLRAARRAVVRAVNTAMGPRPGPVQVLARARKPLEPGPVSDVADRIAREPLVRVPRAQSSVTEEGIEAISTLCASARRGLVVAGPAPLSARLDRAAVASFARTMGFAVAAESTSQLRHGVGLDGVERFPLFSAVYRDADMRERLRPDLIVQIHATPVNAGYQRLLEDGGVRRVVIAPQDWPDPLGTAELMVQGPVAATLDAVAASAGTLPAMDERTRWLARVGRAERAGREAVRAVLEEGAQLTEGRAVDATVSSLTEGALLFVGNSLPVRHLDMWCPEAGPVPVLSQRGASGIDGMIAGAAGASRCWDGPVVLLTGDVAFLHDVGSLEVARHADSPLVIVVLQNDGGRIFEQLPIASSGDAETAMPWFVTPHGLSPTDLARSYGVGADRVATVDALRTSLGRALESPRCHVIEAVVPPDGAARELASLVARVGDAIRAAEAGT